ncbi:hypothetical protein BH23GEM5_BH23GEM5_20840 [soil metagenome]
MKKPIDAEAVLNAVRSRRDFLRTSAIGLAVTVIDKDGWAQPAPWKCDTLNIAPDERWDVIVNADKPGLWAFHCHMLNHAETPAGMFGMVTAMIVEK